MQLEWRKISFKDFIELEGDELVHYRTAGQLLPPESLGVDEFMQLPWGIVKQVQYLFNSENFTYKDLIDALALLRFNEKKDGPERILKETWFDVWKFYNFVVKELEKINNLESEHLSYRMKSEAEQDIVSRLNRFGYFGTLYGLCDGDLLKMETIEKLPYHKVFTHLLYQKELSEVENDLMNLRTKKYD